MIVSSDYRFKTSDIGRKIKMVKCDNRYHSSCHVPAGEVGEINLVDLTGYARVVWNNTTSCNIRPSYDQFEFDPVEYDIIKILNSDLNDTKKT